MLNHIIIMGRLTAEPEFRQTQSGIPVARFSVAVERPRRKDQENQVTDFIRCVAWRQTAEFISRYFGKGAMIALEGRLAIEHYEDRAGNKRESATVVAEQVHFTGERREQSGGGYQAQTYQQPTQQQNQQQPAQDFGEYEEVLSDGEVPF